ncbi:S8 family serine peptidase [Demequina iriomotensis]|uniref:S8 family serine peptidase n=1 Tax=Demequina iriomotensis TaxID=1536641 RepID=UPI0007831BE7|nr:hypothetical protein [Demequina iriomotensis]
MGIANRVIVKLEGGDAPLEERASALAEALPGASIVRISGSGRVLLALDAEADAAAAAAALAALPGVAYAEPDVMDSAQPEG